VHDTELNPSSGPAFGLAMVFQTAPFQNSVTVRPVVLVEWLPTAMHITVEVHDTLESDVWLAPLDPDDDDHTPLAMVATRGLLPSDPTTSHQLALGHEAPES
jgi:hypothetical protein